MPTTKVSTVGGVFLWKDGREVPDTIAITLDFPEQELVLTWQSTFSNRHYGMSDRILGSHGTIERTSGSTEMVVGRLDGGHAYYPEKINRPDGVAIKGEAKDVPLLLKRLADDSAGKTLETNIALLVANASLAARIAVAYSDRRQNEGTRA